VDEPPTTAVVFNVEQASCNTGKFTVTGNTPTNGTGIWELISGTATIANPTNPITEVSGVRAGVPATLYWTISKKNCVPIKALATLTSNAANAGDDQARCDDGNFTLWGNTPDAGATGQWSLIAGTATITSPNTPTTEITDVPIGTSATLRWTVERPDCAPSTDDVILTNDAPPTTADAGEGQTKCNTDNFVLHGNTPTIGTGMWRMYFGTGTITALTNPKSTLTDVPLGSWLQLAWVITNGTCRSSMDIVDIRNSDVPNISPILPATTCVGQRTDVNINAFSDFPLEYALCKGTNCTNFGTKQGSNTFSSITAGEYIVKVSDSNGCFSTAPFTIHAATNDLEMSLVTKNITCKQYNDGTIDVYPKGGKAPYIVQVCTGENCSDFYQARQVNTGGSELYNGFFANTYRIKITDDNGCTLIKEVVITEPDLLRAIVTSTDLTNCLAKDGRIDITPVLGGVPPYKYQLNNNLPQSNSSFIGLPIGNYFVKAIDANGCPYSDGVYLSSPLAPKVFDLTTDRTDICVNQSATLTLSGSQIGVNYQLYMDGVNSGSVVAGTGNPIKFKVTTQGTYVVKAMNNDNCVIEMPSAPYISVHPYPTEPTLTVVDKVCANNSYYISSNTGGFSPVECLYDFTGNSLTPTISGADIHGLLPFGYPIQANATGLVVGGTLTSSGYDTPDYDLTKFIEVTLEAGRGNYLSITDILFDISRDEDGPTFYGVAYYENGGFLGYPKQPINSTPSTEKFSVNTSSTIYDTKIRIYPYGAKTSIGLLRLDNIRIKGNVRTWGGTYEYYTDANLTNLLSTGDSKFIDGTTTPSTATPGIKDVYVAYRSAAGCLSPATKSSITVTPRANGSLSGSTICGDEQGTLTFTASAGTAPFSLFIDDEFRGKKWCSF
jgi:hypothetical protein